MRVSLLLIILIHGGSLFAQDKPRESSASAAAPVPIEVEDLGPEDALNRGTPRGSIIGFVEACSVFDFETAAEYLDLRDLPIEVSELGSHELARRLNHVLSRAVWLDDYTVSDQPGGVKGDGLPEYRDELVKVPVEEGAVPIWMQRVPRGDGEMIWKVSNRSVALVPELYELYSYPPGVETVRGWFPESAAFLGLEAFKWFILVVVGLISWPFLHLAGVLLARVFSSPSRPLYPLVRKVMTRPLFAIGVLIIITVVLKELGMGVKAQVIAEARTVQIIVVVWAIWSVLNLYRNYKQEKLIALDRPGAAKLMRPLTTFVKIVILLLATLFWLNNLGVNITTVLAGLGVGGLAVALALQKPLEDLMGALTIFSQAPLRVGDLVRYKDVIGLVEDIGLRTTRIRTLTNTVVSVPNSIVAFTEIENLTYRTKIRYWPTLRLRYDTTVEQLREITRQIVSMLAAHEMVHDEPIRARVTDFDADAILVKVHCFMKTTDFPESLEIAEDLNLRVMQIVQAAGARFALPGRTLYHEGEAPATRGDAALVTP
jgi:MscS family membrane protein